MEIAIVTGSTSEDAGWRGIRFRAAVRGRTVIALEVCSGKSGGASFRREQV
ncbi:MAG TPA: hypothetical protein VMP00_03900 [Burkholderiales bacterium]|nr:hypothetical protein [Burkholderiales bacterium]